MDRETLIEEAPIYMSQDEVKRMIGSFQSALAIFTQELEHLQAESDELNNKIQFEATREVILTEENEKMNIKYQQVKTDIDSCNDQINIVETALNRGKDLAENAGKAEEYKRQANQLLEKVIESLGSKEEIDEFLMNLERDIWSMSSENNKLKEVNQRLMSDIGVAIGDEKISHRCKNCKKMFIAKQNRIGECFYHPGKLKYYSCKGCGEDAYYSCCSRCIKCSPGCRNGQHIAI
ncbi:unnamed protein product [Blepharisma stoltei]|uniref:Uncharacterized protein n=1 Tax=Blepharisma stoltei TaxID=1481888 RepID=A0AAU9JTP1_9CILI|nr:unnamed protein product [Blepharisma stoltei]